MAGSGFETTDLSGFMTDYSGGITSPNPGYISSWDNPGVTVPSSGLSDFRQGELAGYSTNGTLPSSAAIDPGSSTLPTWLKSLFSKTGDTLSTPAGALTGLAALYALSGGNTAKPNRGYQGGIPKYTASRMMLPQSSTPQKYGAARMGRQYMTPTTYAAEGGVMGYAIGGKTKQPRYLNGHTDGMADEISTSIDGHQPAALSHGEFVIPADVVSHLGNGNSEAGAKQLYKMMDRVREARTGNKKQGKRINPDKFTPGGIAGYAAGGDVKRFDGTGPSLVTTGTAQGATTGMGTPAPTAFESNLSEWAGPYVTDYLGKAQALSNTPYQAYTGPLTAGASPLQEQGFETVSALKTPLGASQATQTAGQVGTQMGALKYNPMGSDFTSGIAQQYMNPYIMSALNPQIDEARRQSQITGMGSQAKLAQAGAFGGGRDAIMRAEADRNLNTQIGGMLGQGYSTAYDKAMQQFNADQARKIGENQFGANFGLSALQGQLGAAQAQGQLAGNENQYGLANLNALMNAGATQRGIEQEGVTADKAQFDTEMQYPYKQLQFQQSMMQGLPVSTQTNTTATSGIQNLASGISGLESLYSKLQALGLG